MRGIEWVAELEKALEDWLYDYMNDVKLKAKLIELGFPDGYADWFMFMVTREK